MEQNTERYSQKLKLASQAEILRSHQRDNDFVNFLREKLLDLHHNFKYKKLSPMYCDVSASLIYFMFTTAMGNQTLGEEYTGIVEINLNDHKVPSLKARITSIILECLGEKGFINMLKKCRLSKENQQNKLARSAISVLNILLLRLISIVPILVLSHRGLFYLYGRYYTIAKRMTGIDYAKVYGIYPTSSVSWGLRLLGLATLVQCMVKLWQNEYIQEGGETSTPIPDENKKSMVCQLCLEEIPNTATVCGHLFCWTCLCDWLSTKSQCPLCREYCTPSRIIHLANL